MLQRKLCRTPIGVARQNLQNFTIPCPRSKMATKTGTSKNWKRPEDDKSVIFVRSELDEYGLDVYEFRVLAHVARREGKGKNTPGKGCFAKQKTIAQVCGMSHRKAQDVLRVLYHAGFLEKEPQTGSTNIYRLAPPSQWKDPSVLPILRKKSKTSDSSEVSPLATSDSQE